MEMDLKEGIDFAIFTPAAQAPYATWPMGLSSSIPGATASYRVSNCLVPR